MTKKELLELEAFKNMPDDTEIVFHTRDEVRLCIPLTPHDCYYIKQVTAVEKPNGPFREFQEPEIHSAFVIDAMPRDYMERKYNMTFKFE